MLRHVQSEPRFISSYQPIVPFLYLFVLVYLHGDGLSCLLCDPWRFDAERIPQVQEIAGKLSANNTRESIVNPLDVVLVP